MAKNKVAEAIKEVELPENEHVEPLSEEQERQQQETRQREWGQQFHQWLINAARRGRVVELLLSQEYPGITSTGNIVSGVPKRIDKDFMQMVVHDQEVWLQLRFIIGCKSVGSPAKVSLAESDS